MSTATIINQTGNQAAVDYDYSKIFVRNNRFNSGLFDEPLGAGAYTLLAGTVMGRIASTGVLAICDSTSLDGSQIPVGIVKEDVVMAQDATNVAIAICIMGDVVESKLLFSGVETVDTVVTITDDNVVSGGDITTNTRRMKDMIQSLGIVLVGSIEMSKVDNA